MRLLLIAALLVCSAAAVCQLSEGIDGAKEPQAASTKDRKFVVVFGAARKIYEIHELTKGTWTKPKEVAELAGMPLGMHRGPRIAISDNTWVITAPSLQRNKGDLFSYVSNDQGQTWNGPIQVNDASEKSPEGLHALVAWTKGRFLATWLDLRNGNMELYASILDKTGLKWEKNTLVYRSPSGSICECCHPSLSLGPKGTVQAMWRNSIEGDRDMFVASSTDGKVFSNAVKLGKGAWKINACPMDGGAFDGSNAAWRREGTVYVSDLFGGQERRIAEGMQPWIAGKWLVWLTAKGGALWAQPIDQSAEAIKLSDQADGPVVVHSQGRHIVLWTTRGGGIQCQTLR